MGIRASAEAEIDSLEHGGSKHGRCTFGTFYEYCHARDILRFICNICLPELRFFNFIFSPAAVADAVRRSLDNGL